MAILGFGTSLAELTPTGIYNASQYAANTTAAEIGPYVAEGILIAAAAPGPENAVAPQLPFTATADGWVSFYQRCSAPHVVTADGASDDHQIIGVALR